MSFNKALLATALIAFGGLASTSMAATDPATATFQVTMTINSACTVSTTGNVAFTATDANSTSDQTANAQNISVICSKGTAYNLGLQSTATGSLTDGTGSMTATGTTDKIPYTLYTDGTYTKAWGNSGVTAATVGTNGFAGTVSTDGTTATKYTVFAKVLGTNLDVTPAAYADTVQVSVYY